MSKLPVGIQFALAYGQERMLLEFAVESEEAQPRVCPLALNAV